MNRRPVGLRIEQPDMKWQGVGLGIHLELWRGPALWKIVRHLEENVKMAGRRKIGRECEESTKRQPREGRKRPEKPKCGKGTDIEKNSRETSPEWRKTKKQHRNEISIGSKRSKRKGERESNDETEPKTKENEEIRLGKYFRERKEKMSSKEK